MTAPTDRARAAWERVYGPNPIDTDRPLMFPGDMHGFLIGHREGRRELEEIVEEQANDPGLWFVAATAPEAYLQQELRRMHEAVEGVSKEECARRLLRAMAERAGKL